MEQQSVIHSTFVVERSYPKPPEAVFSTFADTAKKRPWFAESESHEVEDFEVDLRIGGKDRLRYRFKEGTPFPGVSLINEGTHLDVVPNRRIVTAESMELGSRRISVALLTFELLVSDKGTDLIFTHQGAFFEGSDGPKMREAGWQTLFDRLAAQFAS